MPWVLFWSFLAVGVGLLFADSFGLLSRLVAALTLIGFFATGLVVASALDSRQ